MSEFEIGKYLGIWYELMHYPSWYQRNDNYNTMAEYTLSKDGVVIVHNSTITRGKEIDSYGTATQIRTGELRVDFAPPQIEKLEMSQEFQPPSFSSDPTEPNYVIDKIWTNQHGQYVFAVVTDLRGDALYVLSRYKHPSLESYNMIMDYVIEYYDRDRLVQTPQFD